MPARAPAENFLMCPPLFSCAPPHMRGRNGCLLPTEIQLKCRLVSALQSAHLLVKSAEGQKSNVDYIAAPCRLLGYYKLMILYGSSLIMRDLLSCIV